MLRSAARSSSRPARRSPSLHRTPRAAGDDATAHHRFEDAAAWSKIFDDPARDAWQKPEEVVRELGRRPGASVADLGAGTSLGRSPPPSVWTVRSTPSRSS